MDIYEQPEREPDVLRGRIVFTDGTDLPLSYYRMGREVERFEMDGVRFVYEAEAAKLRALVRDMFYESTLTREMFAKRVVALGACDERQVRELGIEVDA